MDRNNASLENLIILTLAKQNVIIDLLCTIAGKGDETQQEKFSQHASSMIGEYEAAYLDEFFPNR